ncbi:TBC1 domain family member 8 [Merluccius polli]|uniref:TBC1 domain family member 8 n=1 Tax=Merluccius polli TaxID=89951 RepID=A0AA47MHN2_MERPO|nr:TBC1 domain family member 8 [Merluccius polli]
MADIPEDRVQPDLPPFSHVGIDYFGPIEVKRGRSLVKRWGVIFTRLVSRAVHLEVASTLDTASCINSGFYVGEEQYSPSERIVAPTLWVLLSILKHQTVDDEMLQTALCEVESILNDRPITTVSTDPNDLEPLTPNHLLLLKAKPLMPPALFCKDDIYSRKRWKQVQYIANLFWQRWIKEYLPLMQQRQKWTNTRRNFNINDVVVIVDETAPRNSWPLGRVVKTLPGPKGLVRMVSEEAIDYQEQLKRMLKDLMKEKKDTEKPLPLMNQREFIQFCKTLYSMFHGDTGESDLFQAIAKVTSLVLQIGEVGHRRLGSVSSQEEAEPRQEGLETQQEDEGEQDWMVSFAQILASLLTEPALVFFFEKPVDLALKISQAKETQYHQRAAILALKR